MNCDICQNKMLHGIFNDIVGCNFCSYVFEKRGKFNNIKINETTIGDVYYRPIFNDEFSDKLLFSKIQLKDYWRIMKTMKAFL